MKNFTGSEDVGDIDGKFTVMNANVAEIRSRGIELIAALQMTRYLAFNASYTYTDAKVIDGPLTGNLVEGAPRNAASLSPLYHGPAWTLNARARFVGESFQDITNTAVQDAHWIIDLLVAYQVSKHVSLFIRGLNIFNEKYIADGFSRELGAPRQFLGGVRASF